MNHLEIERRFLLKNEQWRDLASAPVLLKQGYLSVEKERTMRVRIVGEQAWLTLKGYVSETTRSEFEYPIPMADAERILAQMCPFKMEKWRYLVHFQGFCFEIDEFFHENAPLIIAELELNSEDSAFPRPDWLGEEITSDGRFTNAYLSKHPFSTWD